MRSLVYGLLAFLVLGLGAILIAPSFIDWNRFKPDIVGQLEAVTGRTIAIDGPVGFTMLPAPTLSASLVRVAGPEAATERDLVELRALDVQIGLFPLLTGTVQIESVTLVAPELNLERFADGSGSWETAAFDEDISGLGGAPLSATQRLLRGALSVSVDRITIEKGSVLYRDRASGREERIEDIDLVLSAESLSGPYGARGSFVGRGVAVELDVAVGEVVPDKRVVFRARADLPGASASFTGGGQFAAPGPQIDGKLSVKGESIGTVVDLVAALFGQTVGARLPRRDRIDIEARIAVLESEVSAEELEIRFGDTVAKGEFKTGLEAASRFDLTLDANRLDIDAWLAALAAPAPASCVCFPSPLAGLAPRGLYYPEHSEQFIPATW